MVAVWEIFPIIEDTIGKARRDFCGEPLHYGPHNIILAGVAADGHAPGSLGGMPTPSAPPCPRRLLWLRRLRLLLR
jgi:hypothetical protein